MEREPLQEALLDVMAAVDAGVAVAGFAPEAPVGHQMKETPSRVDRREAIRRPRHLLFPYPVHADESQLVRLAAVRASQAHEQVVIEPDDCIALFPGEDALLGQHRLHEPLVPLPRLPVRKNILADPVSEIVVARREDDPYARAEERADELSGLPVLLRGGMLCHVPGDHDEPLRVHGRVYRRFHEMPHVPGHGSTEMYV